MAAGAAAATATAKAAPGSPSLSRLALIVVAWILSIVIRFALSRQREYLADAGSVELTKNPDAMISALRKIEGRGELHAANSAVMEMCIDNPREGFADLFATHPSVDARVEALVKFAGGHDPGPLALESLSEPGQPSPRRSRMAHGAAATRTRAHGKPFLPDEPPVAPGGGPGRALGAAPRLMPLE